MRYATIELNSGYVWWVGEAADPIDACRKSDAESKEDKSGTYRRISRSELSRGGEYGGGYAVYEVPSDFDAVAEEYEKVQAHPFVDYYRCEPDDLEEWE